MQTFVPSNINHIHTLQPHLSASTVYDISFGRWPTVGLTKPGILWQRHIDCRDYFFHERQEVACVELWSCIYDILSDRTRQTKIGSCSHKLIDSARCVNFLRQFSFNSLCTCTWWCQSLHGCMKIAKFNTSKMFRIPKSRKKCTCKYLPP